MTIQELLIKHEGVKLHPYKDTADKVSIGVGRNLTDRGISKEEALYLLRNDIQDSIDDCTRLFSFFKELSEVRKMVLIDMMFNLGAARIMKFSRFIEALKAKDWVKASKEMLDSVWAMQVGKRAQRLAYMMQYDQIPEW